MGACCSKWFRDLHEDTVKFPAQCEDMKENEIAPAENNGELANVFIDLGEDMFPVQCTEPSIPSLPCSATFTVYVDTLLWEFHAHVHCH